MIPFESEARLILVFHALLGAATVAVSTHLVVWMRKWLRGTYVKRRAVVRFGWISLALFAVTFVAGNIAYPIYKVNVRSAYLENPIAVAKEQPTREAAEQHFEETSKVVLWFDIKEHWVAMGCVFALLTAVILHSWNPAQDGGVITPLVFTMATAAAATAWLAMIVGLVTSSYRAIG